MVQYPRFWLTLAYAVAAAIFGLAAWLTAPVGAVLFGWCCLASVFVGAVYAFNRPGLLGKRPDGSRHVATTLILFPVLAILWLIWRVRVGLTSEPRYAEVGPGLWVGRRLQTYAELPDDVDFIVDLTAEFVEPAQIRSRVDYRAVPTLDGLAPPHGPARDTAITDATNHQGTVYVHCAFGHGRAVATAAAILILRGHAKDCDDAIRQIRAARPDINPSGSHYAFIAAVAEGALGAVTDR